MKKDLLEALVDTDVQIKFKGEIQPQPLVGKLSKHVLIKRDHLYTDLVSHVDVGMFQIVTVGAISDGKGGVAGHVLLPIIFDAEDVLWLSTGPIQSDGTSAIMTPGGNRSPSGLVIPGQG